MRVAVGIGCDRDTSLLTLRQAVETALRQAGVTPQAVAALASIDRKNDEAGILQLAQLFRWPLRFYSADELSGVPVPNPSETVRKYMGTPAVAEAAALLAADVAMSGLVIEKYKYRGADGKHATVSIARVRDDSGQR